MNNRVSTINVKSVNHENEIFHDSDQSNGSNSKINTNVLKNLNENTPKPKIMTELEQKKKEIFDNNELSDLKRFLGRRKCLNRCNMSMAYIFHAFQVGGIFMTSIATGLGLHDLVWIGVGLNSLASLISMFEKTNDGIMKRMLSNIKNIRDNVYIDESNVVDLEQGASSLPKSPGQ
jgi:hypothetical protein